MAKRKKTSKKKIQKNSYNPFLLILAILLCVLALLAVYLYVSNSKDKSICVVDNGDVVCVDEELSNIERNEFSTADLKAMAINASPSGKYFIVSPDDNMRDTPLDYYDESNEYLGSIALPVARYDMLKIQWSDDETEAYILSDIGVLHKYNFVNKELSQLTDDRGKMKQNEDFSENRRGFIRDYSLIDNEEIALTVSSYTRTNLSNDEEAFVDQGGYGAEPEFETKLYIMDKDGSNIRQVGQHNRITGGMMLVDDSEIIYSVNPGGECEWLGECQQLYSADVKTLEEKLVAGKELEFTYFSYDETSKTLYLARGPGGYVAEVYYGPLGKFSEKVQKVKLGGGTREVPQGNLSIIPLSKDELAFVSGHSGSGSIESFSLETGKRLNSIDAPAINFSGVQQLVPNWPQK